MKFNLQDPALLIPLGVILIGMIVLMWALGKLFKKSTPVDEFPLPDESLGSSDADLYTPAPEQESTPPPPVRTAPASGGTGAGREMSDRLDNMTQKLSDMQSVLQRQTTASAAGTPLTPDTIDKLLKIIGNVTQQVDLLQKSLGTPTTASVPPAQTLFPPATSSTAAKPPSTVTPISASETVMNPPSQQKPAATPPIPAAPATPSKPIFNPTPSPAPPVGGKSIGISGGALSAFPRQTPPGQKPGPGSSTPPAAPGNNPASPPPGNK